MPNYVPKEKEPILNRETIKKDLKEKYKSPPFFRFLLLFMIVLSLSIVICGVVYSITLFLVENGFWFGIYYLLGSLAYAAVVCILSYLLAKKIFIPIIIQLDKFNVCTDTIDRKVPREKVLDFSTRKRYDFDRYRYPSVLYFKKYGRFELHPDIRGKYGEYDGRIENKAARQLDSYVLEKEYLIVTFGKKKPKIALVYDPDDYDVQI